VAKIRRPNKSGRDNQPVIGDEATPALAKIVKQGCEKAKAQGHNMVPWKMEATHGELRCTNCRRLLYVAEIPMPGGPHFGGPSVDEPCG